MLGALGIRTQASILQEEIALKNEELEKLKRQVTQKNIELKAHQNELGIVTRSMSAALEEHRLRASRLLDEIDQFRRQNAELQETAQTLTTAVLELEQQGGTAKEQLEEASITVSELKKVVSELQDEVKTLREDGGEPRSEVSVESMQRELSDLRDSLREERERFDEERLFMNEQLAMAAENCEPSVGIVLALKEEVALAEKKLQLASLGGPGGMEGPTIERYETQRAIAEAKLRAEYAEKCVEWERRLAEQTARSDALELESSELRSLIDELNAKAVAQAPSDEFLRYKERTEKQMERFRATEEVIRSSYKEIETTLVSTTERLRLRDTDVKTLEAELREKEKERDTIEEQARRRDMEFATVSEKQTSEIAVMSVRLRSREAELEGVWEEMGKMNQSLFRLEIMVTECAKRAGEMQLMIETRDGRIAGLETTVTNLISERRRLEEDNGEVREELENERRRVAVAQSEIITLRHCLVENSNIISASLSSALLSLRIFSAAAPLMQKINKNKIDKARKSRSKFRHRFSAVKNIALSSRRRVFEMTRSLRTAEKDKRDAEVRREEREEELLLLRHHYELLEQQFYINQAKLVVLELKDSRSDYTADSPPPQLLLEELIKIKSETIPLTKYKKLLADVDELRRQEQGELRRVTSLAKSEAALRLQASSRLRDAMPMMERLWRLLVEMESRGRERDGEYEQERERERERVAMERRKIVDENEKMRIVHLQEISQLREEIKRVSIEKMKLHSDLQLGKVRMREGDRQGVESSRSHSRPSDSRVLVPFLLNPEEPPQPSPPPLAAISLARQSRAAAIAALERTRKGI